MMSRKAMLFAMAVVSAAGLSGCGESRQTAEAEAAGEEAPALDAQAAEAAMAMIGEDLNAPLADVQGLLATAVEDGDIRPHELMLYAPGGSIPLDWWVWKHGLVRLADEPGYGPYLTLSDKGVAFLRFEASTWLKAALVGSPRMQCRSAGSATSAACSAEVAFTTAVGAGAGVGSISLPQADAQLEAMFTPGAGWSISRLSTDGAVPSDMVRTALFGTADDRAAAREQYATALTAALERLETEARPAVAAATGTAAAAPETPSATTASATSASKPSMAAPANTARTITNASYQRQATEEELQSVYPAKALHDGVAGRSTITCTATVSGRLADCISVAETPPGYRFGQAAVAAARFFRVNPRNEDGRPVESRITFSISWTL